MACRIVVRDIRVSGDADPSCGDACPTGALEAADGRLVAHVDRCVACLACMALCPGKVEVVTDWECGAEREGL